MLTFAPHPRVTLGTQERLRLLTSLEEDIPARPVRNRQSDRDSVRPGLQPDSFREFRKGYLIGKVEGIRAESDGDSGQLTYDVVDGVFKRMCDAVAAKVTRSGCEAMTLEGRRVWKMSLGNTKGDDAHIFDDCIEEGVIRLGYGGAHDYSQCKSREEVQALLEQSTGKIDNAYDYTVTSVMTLVNRMKVGDLVVVTDGNFSQIFGEIKGDYRRTSSRL